jgi:hypothetical protein
VRLCLLPLLTASLFAQSSDVVMTAMRDELQRSMKQLTVENLEKAVFHFVPRGRFG